jgi:hypothetical protein
MTYKQVIPKAQQTIVSKAIAKNKLAIPSIYKSDLRFLYDFEKIDDFNHASKLMIYDFLFICL